ncbi:EpsG family protein [Latilactobacillus sakei]|uniref:EpsG family protein n=1 Tax=Latilactobacillus sakei TaxID=1599 RepID=UPI0020C75448|nr:EpsG family protein [Latilactobacillus sakei]MCP8854241.1 EpsG family protein [Latilactobacillus sakei]
MIFIIVTIILAISFLVNKLQKVFSVVALAVDAYLMANPPTLHNADYRLYKLSYNQQMTNFERGYTYLAKFFFNRGFSYATFREYLVYITFIILCIAIFRLTNNPSLVVLGYNIGLFAIEVIQVRNMLMLALAVLGFSLLRQGKTTNNILGLLVLVVATTFHTLGYFFLLGGLLFLIPWKFLLKGLKIIVYATIPISIMSLFLGTKAIQNIFAIFLSITGARSSFSGDLVSVYDNGISSKSWIITAIIVLVMLIPLFFKKTSVQEFFNDTESKNVLVPSFLGVLSVILTLLSSDYVRLLRDASVFVFIIYSKLVDHMTHKRLLILGYVVVIAASIFWLQNFLIYPESGRYISYTIGLIPDSVIR